MRRVLLAALIILGLLTGCMGRRQVSAEPVAETEQREPIQVTADADESAESAVTEEPDGRVEADGKIRSYLTGEMRVTAQADRRPLAVMMSNDKAALPQYGINRAGVVYEAPVEGGMNRYMAIMEEYDDLDKIGSVRSARTYYTYFAREFDAVYAHFGQSVFAKPYLENMEHINGIEGAGGTAFYRSKDKKAPHNAYTSFAGIQKLMTESGYSSRYSDTYHGHYQFAKTGQSVLLEDETAVDALKVVPGYPISKPYFTYQEEDGQYYRYQYGDAHKGSEGQIKVKNIIIQYCRSGYYSNTEYLDIDVHTSGDGYYITGGRAIPVKWIKDGEFGTTRYYDSKEKEIVLNQGKTWVCIVSAKEAGQTEIYGKE